MSREEEWLVTRDKELEELGKLLIKCIKFQEDRSINKDF